MSYQGLLMLQKPEAYLPIEESSGAAAIDITGNGYDGVFNGIVMNPASGFSVFGGAVSSAYFNGNSHISIAKQFDKRGIFSISCWYRLQSISGYPMLYGLGSAEDSKNTPFLVLSMNGDGKPYYGDAVWGGTRQNYVTNFAASVVGSVVHAVVVVQGAQLKIYFNGVLSLSVNMQGNTPPAGFKSPMVIGAGYDGSITVSNKITGWLSHFAIFTRALTAMEILEQYNVGKAVDDQPYIGGRVLESGVGAQKRIFYFNRATGAPVGAAQSNASGNFVIKTPGAPLGYAVCLDDSANQHAPLIYDRLTPQS